MVEASGSGALVVGECFIGGVTLKSVFLALSPLCFLATLKGVLPPPHSTAMMMPRQRHKCSVTKDFQPWLSAFLGL